MGVAQTNILNGIGNHVSELQNEVFKPESRITIDGKAYLIQRHFIGKRDFREAVFAVVKNEAKRVLLDAS
ncbi:MAG: hypothetical protein FIA99_10290 [Ruminiclostridium sp.]|nr:hypothetical protein [Ruminiclostridium sp.]